MCDFYIVVVLLAFKRFLLLSVFRNREMVDIFFMSHLVWFTLLIFVFFFVASRDCSSLFFIA